MAVVNPSSIFILVCLSVAVFAQTFQYSRGWTNGKKRSGNGVAKIYQEPEGDILGVCQMLRLKEIMTQKKRDQVSWGPLKRIPFILNFQVILPCEILGEPEEDALERFRRKVSEGEPMDQH